MSKLGLINKGDSMYTAKTEDLTKEQLAVVINTQTKVELNLRKELEHSKSEQKRLIKLDMERCRAYDEQIDKIEAENKELKEGISDSISFLDKFSFSSTSETVCGATTRDMHYRITDKLKTLLKQENEG